MKSSLLICICALSSFIVLVRVALAALEPYPFTDGQHLRVLSQVITDPDYTGKYQHFTIVASNQRIQVTTGPFPRYSLNQLMQLDGTLTLKKYQGRLLATMRYPSISLIPETNPLRGWVGKINTAIATIFTESLPQTESFLLLGIVFGIKRNLPKEVLNNMQIAGLMHIIAASGMNVSLVSGALTSLLATLFQRRVGLIISVMGVWVYATLAGLQPSILRASLMGSIALIAQVVGRQYLVGYALWLTGSLMLIVSPDLITDVGFQLSFLATLGIVTIKPLLDTAIKKIPGRILTEDLTTTLSAQLTTLPILLANFGVVNPFSIIINLAVLWTIPPLMVLGTLAVLLHSLHPILASLVLYLAYPLLWYILSVASVAPLLPLTTHLTSIPWPFIFGYYLCLSAVLLIK